MPPPTSESLKGLAIACNCGALLLCCVMIMDIFKLPGRSWSSAFYSPSQWRSVWGIRHLNPQRWLRLATVVFCLLSNISKMVATSATWSTPLSMNGTIINSFSERLASLIYSVSFWISILFYIATLFDRYSKCESFESRPFIHHFIQTIKASLIMFTLTIAASEFYFKFCWTMNISLDESHAKLGEIFTFCQLVMGLIVIILEILFGMRLIFVVLQQYSSQQSRITAHKKGHTRRFIRLKIKMIALYLLLLLFDALLMGIYGIAVTFGREEGIDDDALFTISGACSTVHLYTSYKLLDFFLEQLKQTRSRGTTVDSHAVDSETDIVTVDLLSSLPESSKLPALHESKLKTVNR